MKQKFVFVHDDITYMNKMCVCVFIFGYQPVNDHILKIIIINFNSYYIHECYD